MKMFSILQGGFTLSFPNGEKRELLQLVQLSEHPDDSSIVRIRITPPVEMTAQAAEDASAIEITFDRNGRERSRRLWPMRYPAWDQREPADIDKALQEAQEKEAEALAANAADPTSPDKVSKRGRKS